MNKNEKLPIRYSCKEVDLVTEKILYKGFFLVKKYQFRYKLFNGNQSRIIEREIIERKNAVLLIAYDPKLDSVVLIEQIRIAGINNANSPWQLEMVAGLLDHENENEEDAIRREAKEEAGLNVKRCEKAFSYLPSPGGSNEKLSIYVGEIDSNSIKNHSVFGLESEDEDILVHVISRQKAYNWANSGFIENGGALLGIFWLQLNYLNLQEKWKE